MMRPGSHRVAFAIAVLAFGASRAAVAQEHASEADKDAVKAQTGEYSPYVGQHFPRTPAY